MIRVFSRWEDLEEDVSETATKKTLWEWAEAWVPDDRPGDYNQALMELGAMVCTPRNPSCGECPVQMLCASRTAGTIAERPVKKRRTKVREETVHAAFLEGPSGAILMGKRKPEGLLVACGSFPSTGEGWTGEKPVSKSG